MKKVVSFLTMLIFSCVLCFADSAKPYEEDEFPEWAKHIRRTEIITFGSLPFVTIGVSLAYGSTMYFTGKTETFPNPLDKSSSPYTEEQQLQIVGISLGVSAIFGITDLIVNIVKNKKKEQVNSIIEEQNKIIVVPLSDDEAVLQRKKNNSGSIEEKHEEEKSTSDEQTDKLDSESEESNE